MSRKPQDHVLFLLCRIYEDVHECALWCTGGTGCYQKIYLLGSELIKHEL